MNLRRRFMIALYGVIGALIVVFFAYMSFNDNDQEISSSDLKLVERSILRQAEHERISPRSVRSTYDSKVSSSTGETCVKMFNKKSDVSSLYCYRYEDDRWKLVSERLETQ